MIIAFGEKDLAKLDTATRYISPTCPYPGEMIVGRDYCDVCHHTIEIRTERGRSASFIQSHSRECMEYLADHPDRTPRDGGVIEIT